MSNRILSGYTRVSVDVIEDAVSNHYKNADMAEKTLRSILNAVAFAIWAQDSRMKNTQFMGYVPKRAGPIRKTLQKLFPGKFVVTYPTVESIAESIDDDVDITRRWWTFRGLIKQIPDGIIAQKQKYMDFLFMYLDPMSGETYNEDVTIRNRLKYLAKSSADGYVWVDGRAAEFLHENETVGVV